MKLTRQLSFFALLFATFSALGASLTIDDFLAKPSVIDVAMSPDGKHVASVMNIDDQRAVIVYDLKKGKVISKNGDNIIRPYEVSWANNERLLVKLLVPYKTAQARRDAERKDDFDIDDYFMFGRVVSTDINGGDMVELMNDDRNVKGNVNLARIPHYLPKDKEHIMMAATRRERLALYKVNVYDGKSELVASGGKRTVTYVNDNDGNVLYRYDYLRIAKVLQIYEYTDSKDWDLVDELFFDEDDANKNKVEIEDLVGQIDGKLVYRKLNEASGYHELVTLENSQRSTLVSLKDRDVVGVITRGYNSEVIGYRTLDDVYRSHYFDRETQQRYNAAKQHFTDENFSFMSISDDAERAVILAWGLSNPTTYYTYDLKNDELSVFSYPYKRLPSNQLARGVKIQYLTRDKAVIDAYLLLPPDFDGSKALPLVVMPHGGPQARDSMGYDDFAQFIATRGYLVVQPNFRGSTGYGAAFQQAGYKQWGGLMQEDLEDLTHFLIAEGLADKQKTCIVGLSYGGYAALMATVKTPSLYQCSVSINGVTHLPDLIEHDEDLLSKSQVEKYVYQRIGDPRVDMDMLVARSPALNTTSIKTPILMIHSEEDTRVPVEQSEDMFDALKKHDKRATLITLPESGHNAFYYREDILTIYSEVEAFLQQHAPVK